MSEFDNTSPPPSVDGDERKELELLRHALSASSDVAYSWDLSSDSMTWSANAHHVLGIDESTDISSRSSYLSRVNGADLLSLSCVQENHLYNSTPYQIEYRLRRSDGEFC